MLYASLNNKKIEAVPKTRAYCPLCEKEVFSKCGEIKVWHWAHLQDENCDNWYEPETTWHKDWKNLFGKEFSEIIITKNGEKHIADIRTKNDVVIELQNSPILKPIIRKRELFYGERMLWIINGIDFKDNFDVFSDYRYNVYDRTSRGIVHRYTGQLQEITVFNWKWCRKSWSEAERPIFIDFGEDCLFWVKEGMGMTYGRGDYVSKKRFLDKYLK